MGILGVTFWVTPVVCLCVSEVSSGVPVVSDVIPSSSLVVMSEALLSDSDWEIVEQQSFSFSRKRQAVCVENQEDMNYDGTPVKAPLASRRKIMPPTPQQSLQRRLRLCSCKRWWRIRRAAVVIRRRILVVGTR